MYASQKLFLPTMGCGTWAWGNRLLWGYDESMDEQLQAVFNLCASNSVTLFDTGDSYGTGKLNGRSELLLGRFAKEYLGAGKENICIATKLAAYPWRLTRQSMVSACKSSAKRLGRNVDLVQMHWSTANYAPWQEGALLDGLAALYEQGLVKGVGLSNYGPKRLRWAYKKFSDRGVPISTLQVQYSLLSTYPVTQLGLKEVCDELGIKLIAYSPLALGLLTGKYSQKGSFPKGIRGLLFRQLLPGIQPLLSCLQAIARSRNKTLSQIAINWCICKGTIPIPGAKTVEQAKENLGALGWQLDANEIAELDRAAINTGKKMVQNIFQTK
ncbi:MAG: aldo/keto reductase [Hydrococcus sp. C42_A2020_068]|uniref:aldo/keto reductase n=1 Tax=Pleurocapsa sp. PCC 7327 TaxID=118163 RepID=UPI00029FCF58|nr:aldo/keto reductase [Pleurocapsa sp. PCC 7327]AFY78362.1 putative oxidoreductase, aryl-alcohol dehydrogenase like protein [Pleurocapsa sp. PCC 7327]MBF2022186.1 aldo/keto reductase [Hydrococcus sp. C42_A2020_068]